MPLGIVLSQNAGKYLLSSPMWGVTIGFMLGGGLLYQADFPFTARSWPHHKSPETREKSPAQFQFHLTHLTPLPGITGLAPLTAFSWPAVWFVCLTFPLEFSLHLSGIQRLIFSVFRGSVLTRCFSHFAELLGDYMVKTVVLDAVLSVSYKTWTSLFLYKKNAGTDSWVLLPPRDVRQQQRLPSGNEGGQGHGLWRGIASMGQEAWRPC